MNRRLIVVAAYLTATASAQTKFDNGMEVRFGSGAVHIHTESTLANSPLSTSGVVAIGEGDVSHRMVLGRQGKVVFAYDIWLSPVPNDRRACTVRVTPADRSPGTRCGSRGTPRLPDHCRGTRIPRCAHG
jgi:hypothetical protein